MSQSSKTMWWIAAVLYLLLPVDLLPEILLGPLGLIDDVLAFVFAVYQQAQPADAPKPAPRAISPRRRSPDAADVAEAAARAAAKPFIDVLSDDQVTLIYETVRRHIARELRGYMDGD